MTARSSPGVSHVQMRVQEVNQMNVLVNLDPLWSTPAAIALMGCGLLLMLRGLRGGRNGAQVLLGQQTDMLSRIEGFRLTVFGLVLIGLGAAIIWQAKWLLLLALGIGFVEILESSALIAVWRWDRRRGETHRT
jgi:hypothetical protein